MCFAIVGVVFLLYPCIYVCRSGFTYIGLFCLCGRGISFVGVVCTSVGVVFLFGACFYFRRRGYYTRRLGFTFVGVVLPLFAWFFICRRVFTFVGVFYFCRRGFTFVGEA